MRKALVFFLLFAGPSRLAHADNSPPPTGLADPDHLTRCLEQKKSTLSRAAQMKPEKRSSGFLATAGNCLELLGVPPPRFELVDIDTGEHGRFSAKDWSVGLDRSYFNQPALGEDELFRRLRTALHEGRHAEQPFRTARGLAGRGLSPEQIARALGIPRDIAMKAARQPLRGQGRLVEEADLWCRALCTWGSNYKQHQDTYRALNHAKQEVRAAETRALAVYFGPKPTELEKAAARQRLGDAYAARRRAHAEYRQLLLEVDAFGVGYILFFVYQALMDRWRQR